MRLIDVDAVMRNNLFTERDRGFLLDAPTVDAVEVVRCENCIFYEKALSVQGFCHNHGSIVSANAFCSYGSYGKRRAGGEA